MNPLSYFVAACLGVVLVCWLIFFGLLGMAYDWAARLWQ